MKQSIWSSLWKLGEEVRLGERSNRCEVRWGEVRWRRRIHHPICTPGSPFLMVCLPLETHRLQEEEEATHTQNLNPWRNFQQWDGTHPPCLLRPGGA